MTTLGARIRSLRRRAVMSQSELAAGLVTKSMISQIESDRVQPSRELLVMLAERLGVAEEELLPAQSVDQERAACYKQAQSLLALGHREEALPLLLACLDDPHPGWPLRELTGQAADCLHELGRLFEARAWYEKALRLAVREGEALDVLRWRCRLGEVAALLGEAEVAVQEWRLALREWESVREDVSVFSAADRELIVTAQLGLARAEQESGRPDAALRAFQKAVDVLRGSRGLWRLRASAHAGLGQTLEGLGRWSEAAEHLDSARTLYEQGRDRRAAVEMRAWQARQLGRMGRWDEAEREFADCLRQSLTLGLSELIGQVLVLHAQHVQSVGEPGAALRTLQETICQLPPEDRHCGVLYRALADAMWQAGDAKGARAAAERAVRLLERAGWEQEWQGACLLLARICKGAGDFQTAHDWQTKVNGLLGSRLITTKNLRTYP